jgi:hypothetical protein
MEVKFSALRTGRILIPVRFLVPSKYRRGVSNVFKILPQRENSLWRPSNCRYKWFTCPQTGSINRAEERIEQVHISPKESKGEGDSDNLVKVISIGE